MASLLIMAGSARKASFTRKIAKIINAQSANYGLDAELIELSTYPMPIYDGDEEEAHGVHANAIALKQKFVNADGFILISPEYNSSFSPLLKNALDWVSRSHEEGEPPLAAFQGKYAGLVGASPGGFGGLRGLVPLRMLLGNIGVMVLPNQVAIPHIHTKFNALEDGFNEEATQAMIDKFMTAIANHQQIIK